MQIEFPDLTLPATLSLDPGNRLSDDEYYDFCVANADINFERTSEGEIVIVPPAGVESDYRNVKVTSPLDYRASKNNLGRAFGPTAQFMFPTAPRFLLRGLGIERSTYEPLKAGLA